jgi:uncharacterized protein YukE
MSEEKPESKEDANVEFGGVNVLTNMDTDKQFEGAGIVSDAAKILSGKAGVGDYVGTALDSLGFITNPFGALLGAGLGWLMEHIPVLKDILDLLAGDPEAIKAEAKQWREDWFKGIGELTDTLVKNREEVAKSWESDASQHFHTQQNGLESALARVAEAGVDVSDSIVSAGEICGTLRAVVRDSIADWCANEIVKFIAAQLAAVETLGASEAAFLTDAVIEGGIEAAQDSAKVAKAVEKLAVEAKTLEQLIAKIQKERELFAPFSKGPGTMFDRLTKEMTDAQRALGHKNYAMENLRTYNNAFNDVKNFGKIEKGPLHEANELVEKYLKPHGINIAAGIPEGMNAPGEVIEADEKADEEKEKAVESANEKTKGLAERWRAMARGSDAG